jgi:hypothetical protein
LALVVFGIGVLDLPGETEIAETDLAVLSGKYVRWLNVAVHDVGGVQVLETLE